MSGPVRPSGAAWSVGAAGPLLRQAASGDAREANWRDFAACLDVDPDLFFPDKGSGARTAIAVCATCPVTSQCLDFAMSDPAGQYGVWGATSDGDRRRIRSRRHRQRRQETAA